MIFNTKFAIFFTYSCSNVTFASPLVAIVVISPPLRTVDCLAENEVLMKTRGERATVFVFFIVKLALSDLKTMFGRLNYSD